MTTFKTPTSAKAFHPDVVGPAPQDVIPEALVIATSTRPERWKATNRRCACLSSRSPAPTSDSSPEGDDIDEASPDSSEEVSREQYGQGSAASMMSDAVRRALILKANAAYLSQALPTAPAATAPPPGLLSLPLTNGGTVSDDLDAVIDRRGRSHRGRSGQATQSSAARSRGPTCPSSNRPTTATSPWSVPGPRHPAERW